MDSSTPDPPGHHQLLVAVILGQLQHVCLGTNLVLTGLGSREIPLMADWGVMWGRGQGSGVLRLWGKDCLLSWVVSRHRG